jgi:hypothetical protein
MKLIGGQCVTNEFDGDVWQQPDMTLSPGEGAVIFTPEPFLWTVAGELTFSTNLVNYLPAGESLRGSIVPQAGGLSSQCQFPIVEGSRSARLEQTVPGNWLPVSSRVDGSRLSRRSPSARRS